MVVMVCTLGAGLGVILVLGTLGDGAVVDLVFRGLGLDCFTLGSGSVPSFKLRMFWNRLRLSLPGVPCSMNGTACCWFDSSAAVASWMDMANLSSAVVVSMVNSGRN